MMTLSYYSLFCFLIFIHRSHSVLEPLPFMTNEDSVKISDNINKGVLDGTPNSTVIIPITIPSTTIIVQQNYSVQLFRNLSALANYKGYLDPAFLASINSFWLEFPPTSPTAHYTLAIIYAIMMFVGITGNALVIYMFARCKSLRTPANTLVINLAVSDFLMMAKAPLFIYNSVQLGPATGDFGCRLYGFVGGLTGTVSISTLTAIAIDRYNVVVYPLDPLRSTTRWRSRLMVIFVWLYGLFFSGIPALNIGLAKYVPEGYLTACSFDYLSDDKTERIFMFCYFLFAWVAPFSTITYCYVHILRVVIGANSIQSSKDKNKTEIKLAVIVIGVIGLWFAAWTPYAIVCLLGISGNQNRLSPLGSMLPAIFCKTAACIDPYVYAVTHPRFRLEFGKMFLGRPDTRINQFQTSYSRGASSRRNRVKDTPETIQMNDGVYRHDTANSSFCEESELSISVDLSDKDPVKNPNPTNKESAIASTENL